MKCVKNLELKVLRSGAGYYIGTTVVDPDFGFEEPNCRCSGVYYKTAEAAKADLVRNSFPYRYAMENEFCCNQVGCPSCFSKGE